MSFQNITHISFVLFSNKITNIIWLGKVSKNVLFSFCGNPVFKYVDF